MGFLGSLLGGIGDIFGAVSEGNAAKQDTAGLNQVNNEIENNNSQLNPYISGELANGAWLGTGAMSGYGSLSGGVTGGNTGGPGTVGAYYEGAQSGLGTAQQGTAAAGNYYQGLMQNGLSPSVIANAYGNFNTSAAQNDANIKANYTGPNAAGLMEDANFQNIQGRAQLGGNLAAQDQGVMTQGAQGLMGSAEQYAGLGLQSYGLGSSALGQLGSYGQSLTSQGMQGIEQQNAPLTSIGQEYAGAASQASTAATNDWAGAASGIGSGIAGLATGGMSSFLNGGGGMRTGLGQGNYQNSPTSYAPGNQSWNGLTINPGLGYYGAPT
jgi:hypothetical protein